jgi:hypothetical protein
MVPEYLKASARVLRLRGINFGQYLGAYVHSDSLEGPYLYRFDEHPKSYRLPTIVKLAIFFYPSKGHGSKRFLVDPFGRSDRREATKSGGHHCYLPHTASRITRGADRCLLGLAAESRSSLTARS